MENKNKETVLVCGAGHQGLSMAAHLALNGVQVNLWNRSKSNIENIIKTKTIHCDGTVCGNAKLNAVSSDISDVISNFIMVATPSTAHRDIAKLLAPFVNDKMIVILNPGRTFGAIDFYNELKNLGVNNFPIIAETQTIIYTCRKTDSESANIIAFKNNVKLAALKQRIPQCLDKYFSYCDSVGFTSFSNVGMILHCAPVLMNIGWIESNKVDFKYYYDGISTTIASFCEKLDSERIEIALKCGFEVDTVIEWLKKSYDIAGNDLYQCLQNNEAYRFIDAPPSLNTRYLYEDISNGLVPIEYIGKSLNIHTKAISTIIDLACMTVSYDFRKYGRQYSLRNIEKWF